MNTARLYIVLFLGILFLSCKNPINGVADTAFIGGEIVNPYSNLLLLYNGSELLDTILLDQNNRFSFYLKEMSAGDYKLNHHNENQTLYLHPGDSLLIYANTLEFDESLYFSGIGAEKNNLLIDLYLMNEETTNLLLDYQEIAPKKFKKKADSILEERLAVLAQKDEKYGFPEDFLNYAEGVIMYENYDLRERYVYLINKYKPEEADHLDKEFCFYHEEIDFNNKMLQDNPAYLRFIGNYLVNESIKQSEAKTSDLSEDQDEHLASTTGSDSNQINEQAITDPGLPGTQLQKGVGKVSNTYGFENISKRINLIDSLSQNKAIRDYFFGSLGSLGVVMGENQEELVNLNSLLARKGYSSEGLEKLRQLRYVQLAFLPGVSIGYVPLINPDQKEVRLDDQISNESVLYLWSLYAPQHSRKVHSTMAKYKEKYPEIDFIGINIDVGQTSRWAKTIQEESFNPEMEFQLGKTEISEGLFLNYLNKTIFLNAQGEVVIGDADYNSPEFEEYIKRFLELQAQK